MRRATVLEWNQVVGPILRGGELCVTIRCMPFPIVWQSKARSLSRTGFRRALHRTRFASRTGEGYPPRGAYNDRKIMVDDAEGLAESAAAADR